MFTSTNQKACLTVIFVNIPMKAAIKMEVNRMKRVFFPKIYVIYKNLISRCIKKNILYIVTNVKMYDVSSKKKKVFKV